MIPLSAPKKRHRGDINADALETLLSVREDDEAF
jgi:hypothetical protein